MKHQHARILEALFAHPLRHDVRISAVEALLQQLGATVERLPDHRLHLQLGSGEALVLRSAAGRQPATLDEEGVLRLRRCLQQAGITPEHPQPPPPATERGDQARRLVIHLDHRGARLWWLDDAGIRSEDLQPRGLWSSGQRLSHRHDRDVAGQRAPLDHAFLERLSQAVETADRVLLLGHGKGQSDLRQLLQDHLSHRHPSLLERLETIQLDDTACSDAELLAMARQFYGHAPQRRPLQIPGQERREAGPGPRPHRGESPPR